MRSIIVILGPTSSGKSALGARLATRFKGVVISADSRQVYRGLDVCFGTVTKREMRGVPHRLLRFVPLRRQYTAGEYAQAFRRILRSIPLRTPIFLVGGSPFYIEAALHPERLAPVRPNHKLRRQLEKLSTEKLVTRLSCFIPRSSIIDPHNRRRLIRAIEIIDGLRAQGIGHRDGVRFAHVFPSLLPRPYPLLTARVLKIGIKLARKELYQKIDQRVDQRLALGMLEEVRRAHQHGISWQRLESLGLEPRYLSRVLRGQLTDAQGIQQLKGAIHAFARRQLTWWRRDRAIRWVRTSVQAERLVRRFLAR